MTPKAGVQYLHLLDRGVCPAREGGGVSVPGGDADQSSDSSDYCAPSFPSKADTFPSSFSTSGPPVATTPLVIPTSPRSGGGGNDQWGGRCPVTQHTCGPLIRYIRFQLPPRNVGKHRWNLHKQHHQTDMFVNVLTQLTQQLAQLWLTVWPMCVILAQ